MADLKSRLGRDFPDELIEKSYSLDELGISEYAWKYEDILRVIEYCREKGMAILGGDIYFIGVSGIEYTYDSWYINQDGRKWKDYVVESKKKALDYINTYYSKTIFEKDKILYVIVSGKEEQ